MKEEKEQMSAVGSALTMMVEMIIIRMLQPMKDMINELKSDVESVKVWCAEYISVEKFNDLVISMQDMKSNVELSINEAINSMGMPTLPQLDVMFSGIEEKVKELDDRVDELDDKIDEVEDSRVDNESSIEDNDSNIDEMDARIEEVEIKLGLVGDILNQ